MNATAGGRRGLRSLPTVALVALLAVLPLLLPAFQVERLSATIATAIAVLGLVVLTGWSGQISLGNGAFFGIGAYTTAILVAHQGWPHLATLALAGVIGLLCGALAGLPALRVTGIYLALVSLALATSFPPLVQHFQSLTGGTQGMAVPAFTPWFSGISQERWGYYVALVIAVPLFLLARDFGQSRCGRALRALRDSEPAAKAMGIAVARYKVAAFAISGGLAGVAGSLSVLVQPFPYIDPRSYLIVLSIGLLTGLVVGGAGSVIGAALGALFLDRVPTLVTDSAHLSGSATNLFYGGLLILLMFVMPGGVVGLVSAGWRRLPRRGWRRHAAPVAGADPMPLVAAGGPLPEPSPDQLLKTERTP